MKKWIVLAVVLLAAGGAYFWWKRHTGQAQEAGYRTAKIERGDLVQSVRATGIVQPILMVQVGTQVNGPVRKLYVDFNDRVKAGDLVAQIDPIVYEARLAQDQANLTQSEASVEETKAKLVQADKELERSRKLMQREMLSQSDLDAAIATRDTLAAQLKVVEAAVEQAKASLRLSKANLDYTTIRSPVDGIVIARNVSEGQTVVASMSAQVLFNVATDLRQVQVEASVPEADIGRVHVGQPVVFTVDAFEQSFTGKVSQVRRSATTVQNVVTYPVIILAENADEKLFPGMTASIVCEVAHLTNVLKVANAALRFKPEGALAEQAEEKPAAASGHPHRGAKLWAQDGPGLPPKPVHIRTGLTDSSFTEIREPAEIAEGQEVIVGAATASNDSKSDATVNPFAPPRPPGGSTRRAMR